MAVMAACLQKNQIIGKLNQAIVNSPYSYDKAI